MSPSEVLAVSAQVEKLGIIGILAAVIVVIGIALYKLRKTLILTYRQRDKARMLAVRYRSALDHHQIRVDVADIEQTFKDDAVEEAAQ